MLHKPTTPLKSKDSLSEYWQGFIDYLEDQEINYIDIEEIRKACRKIEINHKWRPRHIWWDYVEHLYEAARNYIDMWWEITQEGIIACLHHDDIEDVRWQTFETFKGVYGTEVAFIIHILSRKVDKDWRPIETREAYLDRFRDIDKLISFMKQEATKVYIELPEEEEELENLARRIATIKICDRVNNLSTEHKIGKTNQDKLRRAENKLEEVERIFVPLVESMKNPILFDRVRKEIIFLIRRINKLKAEIWMVTES